MGKPAEKAWSVVIELTPDPALKDPRLRWFTRAEVCGADDLPCSRLA